MNNPLLTKRKGRTGEYWPEVVAVWTEQSEVRTAITEGQYSPVQPEQVRLVKFLKCIKNASQLLILKLKKGFLVDQTIVTKYRSSQCQVKL